MQEDQEWDSGTSPAQAAGEGINKALSEKGERDTHIHSSGLTSTLRRYHTKRGQNIFFQGRKMRASGKCYFSSQNFILKPALRLLGIWLPICMSLGLAIKPRREKVVMASSCRTCWEQSLLGGCFMRKGESKLAPGKMVQQQPTAVAQELPTLQHTDLSISTSQKRTY